MSMLIEVWGSYGCFTRPEMKTERVSYDMITPSAARGLVEAIYWHPGLRYTVDRIYLLKPFGLDPEDEASTEEYTQRPIRFTNIRRNEVKSTLLSSAALSAAKGGTPPVLYTSEDIQQRAAMVLQDVHYVIECHFDLTDKAAPQRQSRQVPGHPAPTPAQRPVLSPALFRVPGVPGQFPGVAGRQHSGAEGHAGPRLHAPQPRLL